MTALSVIGLNHRTAPVAVREEFAMPGRTAETLLKTIRRENVLEEALVLDTCNRTEVYFVARRAENPLGYLLDHVARLKAMPPVTETSMFYRYDGLEAVEHLFRVAASLDSQIVGEHQILGQAKAAYRTAVEARTARFFLNKLLHWAFRVGKRVLTETDIGRGSVSVAQAAVELARRTLSNLTGKTVLLVGAGQNAECAAAALIREGAGRLIVANRTLRRAQRLARDVLERRPAKAAVSAQARPEGQGGERARCPALLRQQTDPSTAEEPAPSESDARAPTCEAIGLEDIPAYIAATDLVISSTAAPHPVLTRETLAEVLGRMDHPLCLIDVAVPRDIDPRLGQLPNAHLYNMDDLDGLVAENLERRRQEIPRAEAIVGEEVRAFSRWLDSLQVAPTIRLLQKHFETVQQNLTDQYASQFSDADRRQLEQFTRSLCNRILHKPVTFLRGLCEEAPVSDTLATVEAVRRMFDLDAPKEDT